MRLTTTIILLSLLGTPALAQNDAEDLLRTDAKAGRLTLLMGQTPTLGADTHALVADAQAAVSTAYQIGIGVFGAYNPSIYPDKTWIDVACFGEPERSYPGTFSLVYIDIVLYNGSTLVHNSTATGADRGICDVNRGVDTSFIEIQRGLVFDSWTIFVTEAEKSSKGVQTGDTVYRRPGTLPAWCSDARWQCEQATVRYNNWPVHLYQ